MQSLRGEESFRRVLSEGRRQRQGGLVVVKSPGQPGPPRVGFVVSRRSGNAVTRNRIKRRLRHAVAGRQLQPGNDYVIIADKQVADAEHETLVSWLQTALRGGLDGS
ncbi:MAG: ribonuclease P protein component [Acidimicrobiia bacterium]|nr:ribonuclease P protein component [Acidimicrobiia bacterium]